MHTLSLDAALAAHRSEPPQHYARRTAAEEIRTCPRCGYVYGSAPAEACPKCPVLLPSFGT